MNTVPAYEACVMKHPHARKGKITQIKGIDGVSGRPFTDSQGEPDVFPDVTVKDPQTEAYYRSRGYIVPGEVPPPPAEYAEYPVMLAHPDHVDAIPDDWHIEKGDSGEIIRHKILGKPEVLPPRQANTKAEEIALGKQGYKRAGVDDPEAIRRSTASPYVAGRETQEFPKMKADGAIEDPNAQQGGPIQYPKWIGEKLVNSRAEEEALTGKKVDVVLDVCIICDEVILASEPRATGKNGSYHLAHMPAKPDQLPDGRVPLEKTARQLRKDARDPNAAQKRRGRPPKVQAAEA